MLANVATWRVPGRLAYVVNHSYPYSSNGYAVRTHGVAKGLQQLGLSIIVINRPGTPWDSEIRVAQQTAHQHSIDGVRYLFIPEPSRRTLSQEAWQIAASNALQDVIKIFKPAAIMAASNWENAQPALNAARTLGLPFFYEVRGFWEVSRISRDPDWYGTAEYQQAVDQETQIASQADHVFTLNSFMQQELIRRGVKAHQIDQVPNAWPQLPDLNEDAASIRQTLGLKSRYIIGYIGSFNAYEGLEDLIQAAAQLVHTGIDLSLLLVGSGNSSGWLDAACPSSEPLRQLAAQSGIGERLFIQNRVSQQQLSAYYQLLDLVVIPRRPLPVTELVSPIKPLEAAAQGRALLLSDVTPLKAFAEEAGAALFRKGDREDLVKQIRTLLNDDHHRQLMGQQLRHWVGQQRLFEHVVKPIHTMFCN